MKKSVFVAAKMEGGSATNKWFDLVNDKIEIGKDDLYRQTLTQTLLPDNNLIAEDKIDLNDTFIYKTNEKPYGAFAFSSMSDVNGKNGIILLDYFDHDISSDGEYAIDYIDSPVPSWIKNKSLTYDDLKENVKTPWLKPENYNSNESLTDVAPIIDAVISGKRVLIKTGKKISYSFMKKS